MPKIESAALNCGPIPMLSPHCVIVVLRDSLWVYISCPFHSSHPLSMPGVSKSSSAGESSRYWGLCSDEFNGNLLGWSTWITTGVCQRNLHFNEGTLHSTQFGQSIWRIIMGLPPNTWRFKAYSVFKGHRHLNIRPSGQEQIWTMESQISQPASGRAQLGQTPWTRPFTSIAWVNLSPKPAGQEGLLKSTWQTLRFNKSHTLPCSSSSEETLFAYLRCTWCDNELRRKPSWPYSSCRCRQIQQRLHNPSSSRLI